MASTSQSSSTAVASSTSPSTSEREQSEARLAVLASLQSAGSAYDSQLQRRAADLHANSAAIAKQEAELQAHTKALAKETERWRKETDKAADGLKQFGDLQNWAEMLERDLMVVEETLRLAEGEERQESASGGSTYKPE